MVQSLLSLTTTAFEAYRFFLENGTGKWAKTLWRRSKAVCKGCGEFQKRYKKRYKTGKNTMN